MTRVINKKLILTPGFLTNLCNHRAISSWYKTPFIIAIMLLGIGCTEVSFYNKFYSIPNEAWEMSNVPDFEVKVTRPNGQYRLMVQVRNTTDYPYSNIFFFFTTTFPRGEQQRDTIECLLADRYGRWLGTGAGRIRENSFLIKHSMFLSDTGTYVFKLEQAMRDEKLKGITDVGIRIEQVKPAS